MLTRAQLERFRALVSERAGVPVGGERLPALSAVLGRRLRAMALASFDAYFERINEPESGELSHLVDAVTPHQSHFFRGAEHFDVLRARLIVPAVEAARLGAPKRLRLWCASVAAGEEAYALAITLLESIPEPAGWDLRVLASDADPKVLTEAARAVYRQDALGTVPEAIVARWFVRGGGPHGGTLRLRREARALVAFRQMELAEPSWPLRTRFDAIFLRDAHLPTDLLVQRGILERCAAQLAPGGFLFLGTNEASWGARVGLELVGNGVFRRSTESP